MLMHLLVYLSIHVLRQLTWRLNTLHQFAEVPSVILDILLHVCLVHRKPVNNSAQKLKLTLLHSLYVLNTLTLARTEHFKKVLTLLRRTLVDPLHPISLQLDYFDVYRFVSI